MVRERAIWTQEQQGAIRAAAAGILAHPILRSSERSSRLFRYLADQTIADDAEGLKERHIGHEVYGREISYDTAEDPIVRNAASDLRKRLRQYDSEFASGAPVHIVLEPGTYLLNFRFAEPEAAEEMPALPPSSSDSAEVLLQKVPPPMPGSSDRRRSSLIIGPPLPYWIALAALLGCVLCAGAFLQTRQELQAIRDSLPGDDPLWKPMLGSGKEVFVCLGHAQPLNGERSTVEVSSAGLQRITMTDLKAYTNISGFLQMHHQNFQMRTDSQTTLLDLQNRPTVLIGIGNNQWTQRLTNNLRFRFDLHDGEPGSAQRVVGIVDREHPEQKSWKVDMSTATPPSVNYAIAGRTLDHVTGGLVLYVAGAGAVGTQAASEFVTQPSFLRTLPAELSLPVKSFQVVLRMPIVDGIPGPPEVIAKSID